MSDVTQFDACSHRKDFEQFENMKIWTMEVTSSRLWHTMLKKLFGHLFWALLLHSKSDLGNPMSSRLENPKALTVKIIYKRKNICESLANVWLTESQVKWVHPLNHPQIRCRQNCIGLGQEESPHCRRRTSWIQKPLIPREAVRWAQPRYVGFLWCPFNPFPLYCQC